jgi:hypothetical protein
VNRSLTVRESHFSSSNQKQNISSHLLQTPFPGGGYEDQLLIKQSTTFQDTHTQNSFTYFFIFK